MIKILRWGKYLGLSRWAQPNHVNLEIVWSLLAGPEKWGRGMRRDLKCERDLSTIAGSEDGARGWGKAHTWPLGGWKTSMWQSEGSRGLSPTATRNWLLPTNWMSKEAGLHLELPGRNSGCRHPDFRTVRPMPDFWPTDLWDKKFVLPKPLSLS